MPGPLQGVRVVELASDHAALAGKLLADLGADAIVVEPPGGHVSRTYEPFVDDEADPERSLWWWHYNTSKRGVVADLDTEPGRDRFRALCAQADVVIEGEPPGRLAALHVDHEDLRQEHDRLVWVSVTPFGRSGPRSGDPASDLTLLASGGAAWSCGYDDHQLPPVRGGGNQAYHLASVFAAVGALTALVHRDETGRGQLVDVNANAAVNVSTELATYEWLVGGIEVQRQTGRHAYVEPTLPTTVAAADGKAVNTGVPPRDGKSFQSLLDWLDDLGLRDEFPESVFLELGSQRAALRTADFEDDVEAREIYGAGRDALLFLADRLSAYDFFTGAQERGLSAGVVYSPEEAFRDAHLVAREFPTPVAHPELDRVVEYPGPPYRFSRTPWEITRPAPHVAQHDHEVFGSEHDG